MDLIVNTIKDGLTEADAILTIKTLGKIAQFLSIVFSSLFVKYPDYHPKDGDSFDFIIVGGGTAGLIVARRLTEIPDWKVLVVEAGGDPPVTSVVPGLFAFTTNSNVDYAYFAEKRDNVSQALNHNRVMHTRGKMLGGSSSLDHLIWNLGYKEDFDEWVEMGLKDWTYENVLKYFKKGEKMLDPRILNGPTAEYHSTDGLMSISAHKVNSDFLEKEEIIFEFLHQLGLNKIFDSNVPFPNGTSKINVRVRSDSRRSSTAQEYLLPVKDRPNLKIMKHAQVIKIITNNKVAKGVTIKTVFNQINVFATKEVILSAGVFNSPKLLMLSGIGPEIELKKFDIDVVKDLPVGFGLQDHLSIPIVMTGKKSPITKLESIFTLLEAGTLPLPLVFGSIPVDNSTPDFLHITTSFGAFSPFFLYILNVNFNYGLPFTLSHLVNHPLRELFLTLVFLSKPNSRGRVTIRSRDPKDPPIIETGYFNEPEDLKKTVAAVRKIYGLKDTPYFKSIGGDFSQPNLPQCKDKEIPSLDYWECYTKSLAASSFHAVGSCPMLKVVDSNLNVIGVKNLRIIDDSVMPKIPRGEPGTMVVVIAEMASDFIKSKYGYHP